MPPTKKAVRYRTGSTCGGDNCNRCIYYLKKGDHCDLLETAVKRGSTCEAFVQDPNWKNPYAHCMPSSAA